MKKILRFAAFITLLISSNGFAKDQLKVVTTIPDLQALASEIGGAHVVVDSIAKGTQDPHFVEAKPSYMTKFSKADLVIAVGLDLEIGWLPTLITGSRNPKIIVGTPGYLELGAWMEPIQIPSVKISRAQGDVHPFGNPHYYMDPIRMGKAAVMIAERLGQIDPKNQKEYAQKGSEIQNRLEKKTLEWKARIEKTGVKKIVTFHQTLNYFLDRFGIQNAGTLEPKPGIPPSPKHILEIIEMMKAEKLNLILVENFFDASVTKRIKQDIPDLRTESIPVEVGGEPNIESTDDLIERVVKAIEGK